jgi:hypothetical protein
MKNIIRIVIFIISCLIFSISAFAESNAFERLKKAANRGDKGAQMIIAQMYYYGGEFGKTVIQQDYQEAFKWYQKASQKKVAPATYKVALMYYEGNGVLQNQSIATKMIETISNDKTIIPVEVLDKMVLQDKDIYNYLQ